MDIKKKLHDPDLSAEERKRLKDQAARYKLILNTTSGCMKDKFKKIYDPEYNTKMCMLGQLALTDLIFKLKKEVSFELLNTNTDGIAIEINALDDSEEKIEKIRKDWENTWHFSLEKTVAYNLYQKDVNNYVFTDESGHMKLKGAYVNKYEDNEQNTLSILAKAVVNYFLYNTDIKTTICNPDNPATDYQMIKKIGNMYNTPTWAKVSGDEIVQKVNRIFPSTDKSLGGLYKHKRDKSLGVLDKVEGTPEHVLIVNTDIRNKKIGELKNIDYNWYINEAQKRLDDFMGIKRKKIKRLR